MARRNRTAEEMFPIIESSLGTGRTRQQIADEHRISLPVLDYWRRRYRRSNNESGGFEEVSPGRHSEQGALLEIYLPDGTHLRYSGPEAAAVIRSIVGRAA